MNPPENRVLPNQGGAESGARTHSDLTSDLDPDLSRLMEAWPNLPAPIKAGILALVRAAT